MLISQTVRDVLVDSDVQLTPRGRLNDDVVAGAWDTFLATKTRAADRS